MALILQQKRGQLDLLANYLQRKGKARRMDDRAHTAGWHDGAYVMPDGHIIGTPSRPVAFCGGTSAVAGYIVRGTAESWRKNVGNLMKRQPIYDFRWFSCVSCPTELIIGR